MIFVCENNGYAEFTPLSAHTKVERLAQHAKTYGIRPARSMATISSPCAMQCKKAVEKCRAGKGPVFVECLTQRMRGHYEGDPAKYRELARLAEWKKKDPIARARARAEKQKSDYRQGTRGDRSARPARLVEKAAEFALSSPWPADSQVDSQLHKE